MGGTGVRAKHRANAHQAAGRSTATFANGYKLVDLVQGGSEGRIRRGWGGGGERRGRLLLLESSQSRCLLRRGIYGPGASVPEEAHAGEDVVRKFYFCFDDTARPPGGNAGPGGGRSGSAPSVRLSAGPVKISWQRGRKLPISLTTNKLARVNVA